MKKYIYDIIIQPILSEKSSILENKNKYTLIVRNYVNKINVKLALENIFKTKIEKVNVINMKSKKNVFRNMIGYSKSFKKIIVTTKNKIDYTKIV